MRALLLQSSGVRFTRDHPAPRPGQGEALVRVLTAGICETDLQLVRGYMGFTGVLGHEFVGRVESGALAGRRVVGEINCGCGACDLCHSGLGNHCPRRTVLGILGRDGAFADFLTLPEANLHVVPEEVSTVAATLTEPLAAAFQIPAQMPLRKGLPTVVLGDGRLGNLCAQVLQRAGCQVTVVGKHPEKMAVLQALGLATVPLDQFQDRRCAELVVDCTGSSSGLPLALQIVQPRGTVVLKTTVAGEQTLALAPVVIDEVTVVGSRCGPFPRALQALANHEIDVEPLITGIVPLEEGVAALERVRTTPVLKVLFDVAGDAG
ncbi:MAG: MDR/zinc-dependent alcohol dehydrogenase-like family protein [Planctomycetales bacterium]